MKRVSFSVAKALKEAGYPQDWDNTNARYIQKEFRVVTTWYREGEFLDYEDSTFGNCAIAPTYLEVWLWLWREKNIQIDVDYTDNDRSTASILIEGEYLFDFFTEKDPEDALEQVIEYLVEHNLIK